MFPQVLNITKNIIKNDKTIFEIYENLEEKFYASCLINETCKMIGYNPFLIIKGYNDKIIVNTFAEEYTICDKNIWQFIDDVLQKYNNLNKRFNISEPIGCICSIGYNTACEMNQNRISSSREFENLPKNIFIFYKNYIFLEGDSRINIDLDVQEYLSLPIFANKKNKNKKFIKSNFSKWKYIRTVKKAKKYILSGDIYQVNISQRFFVEKDQDEWQIFKKLYVKSNPRFAFFLDASNFKIITCSPERFLAKQKDNIFSEPIKGTSARGENVSLDADNIEYLLTNAKEESELAMIVDMTRNDLSKSAVPGTVVVDEFKRLEKYPNVFHLVAKVSARVCKKSVMQIIHDAFPPASVTGCPKKRALEIINELEKYDRGFYCGCVGWISLSGDFDLAMNIRGVLSYCNTFYYNSGSGIVLDSIPKNEYSETLHKAEPFLDIFK